MSQTILKIILSFFISGIWITFATRYAEKLGSFVGGLVANLPSNIVVSLLFISIVNSPSFGAQSALSVPVGMTIDTFFLFAFILLLRFNLIIAAIGSLLIWGILAFFFIFIGLQDLLFILFLYTITTLGCYIYLEKKEIIIPQQKSYKRYSMKQILIRAVFAGSVVSGAVIISTYSLPYISGIFSTFPAVMLSTMVILTINQSKEFARAVGKIMLISSSNIIVYALLVSITYPTLGLLIGTVLAFIGSCLWILLFSYFMKNLRILTKSLPGKIKS